MDIEKAVTVNTKRRNKLHIGCGSQSTRLKQLGTLDADAEREKSKRSTARWVSPLPTHKCKCNQESPADASEDINIFIAPPFQKKKAQKKNRQAISSFFASAYIYPHSWIVWHPGHRLPPKSDENHCMEDRLNYSFAFDIWICLRIWWRLYVCRCVWYHSFIFCC